MDSGVKKPDYWDRTIVWSLIWLVISIAILTFSGGMKFFLLILAILLWYIGQAVVIDTGRTIRQVRDQIWGRGLSQSKE